MEKLKTHAKIEICWDYVFHVGKHDIFACQFITADPYRCAYVDFKKLTAGCSYDFCHRTSLLTLTPGVVMDERFCSTYHSIGISNQAKRKRGYGYCHNQVEFAMQHVDPSSLSQISISTGFSIGFNVSKSLISFQCQVVIQL